MVSGQGKEYKRYIIRPIDDFWKEETDHLQVTALLPASLLVIERKKKDNRLSGCWVSFVSTSEKRREKDSEKRRGLFCCVANQRVPKLEL